MKKQALLLMALVSCANASALTMPTMPTMPTIDVQACKLALTTALNNNTKTIGISAMVALAVYVFYKSYTNGGSVNNPETTKESESNFMKYGTSFPTSAQTRSKELLPATAVVVAPVAVPDTTPAQEAALDEQDAYWEKFLGRQMEILS